MPEQLPEMPASFELTTSFLSSLLFLRTSAGAADCFRYFRGSEEKIGKIIKNLNKICFSFFPIFSPLIAFKELFKLTDGSLRREPPVFTILKLGTFLSPLIFPL
jgi:hypothetical protein